MCCFFLRAVWLSNELLGQGYVKERTRSSIRNFYGRYGHLIKQYEAPFSRLLHEILNDDHIQLHPQFIRHKKITLSLIATLLPNLKFYLIARSGGFHGTFATGAACQQWTITPLDTWSCPTLGISSALMLRPIPPVLVLFPDFWVSNIPRYFCFAFFVLLVFFSLAIVIY